MPNFFIPPRLQDLYSDTGELLSSKKDNLAKASTEKQIGLTKFKQEFFNKDSFYDADDFEGQRVTYENGQGKTFDAFEIGEYGINPDTERGRKKFNKQAISAAALLGKETGDVTRDDITTLGKQAKEQAYLEAMKGYVNVPPKDMLDIDQVSPFEGPMAPVLNVRQHGIDPYSDPNNPRKLVETQNVYTGRNLLDAMNRPDINADFSSRFNREGERAFDETPAGKEAILEKTDRTNAEIIGDLTAGIAKFGINTGAALYGISDVTARTLMQPVNALASQIDKVLPEALKSGKTLGQDNTAFGNDIASNFARTNKIIDKALLSDQTKLSQKKLGQQIEEFNKGSEERKAKWIKDKKLTSIGAEVVDMALGVMEGVEAGIDNPLALSDILVTSAPQLITGGIFGKAAVSKVLSTKTANMGTKEAAAYVASKQGKAVIDKVATRTGIATEAVQESMINAIHKQGEVMDYTHDYLMETSELYQSNIADGMDQYSAKLDVANSVFNTTAAITAVISSGASKFTGTGKATGKLFVQDGPVSANLTKNLLIKSAKTGDKILGEGVQELIQEGGTELAGNIATKAFVDPDQKLTEGVGTSAGLGALAGVATAGVIQATADTVKGISASTKGAKIIASKTKEKVKETAKSYVENKQDKVIVDPKAEGYEAQSAFDVTVKKGTRDSDTKTYREDLKTHGTKVITEIKQDIIDAQEELKGIGKGDPNLTIKITKLRDKEAEVVATIKKQMQLIKNQEVNDSIKNVVVDPKNASTEDIQTTDTSIKTSDRFGNEELDSIISNKDMPDSTVEAAKLRKSFNESESKLNDMVKRVKSKDQVRAEVLTNTKKNAAGKYSVIGYRDAFKKAIASGNKVEATKLFKDMQSFKDNQISKIETLNNIPIGETAQYSDQYKSEFTNREIIDDGKRTTFAKVLAKDVQIEVDYLNKYLALMGKKGKETFTEDTQAPIQISPELDISLIEEQSVEDLLANMDIPTQEAPVEVTEEVSSETDTIVTTEVTDIGQEKLSPIPEPDSSKKIRTATEVSQEFDKILETVSEETTQEESNKIRDTIDSYVVEGSIKDFLAERLYSKLKKKRGKNTVGDIVDQVKRNWKKGFTIAGHESNVWKKSYDKEGNSSNLKLKDIKYIVIRHADKNKLVDIDTLKVLKRRKQGFDNIKDILAELKVEQLSEPVKKKSQEKVEPTTVTEEVSSDLKWVNTSVDRLAPGIPSDSKKSEKAALDILRLGVKKGTISKEQEKVVLDRINKIRVTLDSDFIADIAKEIDTKVETVDDLVKLTQNRMVELQSLKEC